MNILVGIAVLAVFALLGLIATEVKALKRESAKELRLLEVKLSDIAGKQAGLKDEYREVHKILETIRDLNTAELQDRKEILQHQNLSAANRVLQARKFMSDLEDAARKELEGLRNG